MNDTMPQIGGAPYRTPQVRRKLPAPYSRPRIDMDGATRVKRAWQDVSVMDLAPGDTVAGFGLVEAKQDRVVRDPHAFIVRLLNVAGDTRDYPAEQRVFAFAKE